MEVARLDVQLRGCGDRGKAGGTTKMEEDKDAAVCRVSATRSQWSRPSILPGWGRSPGGGHGTYLGFLAAKDLELHSAVGGAMD